jgi:hypothetical protein
MVNLGSTKPSYETEAALTFKPAVADKSFFEESKKIREKYTLGDNVGRGGAATNDMLTQAMVKEGIVRQGLGGTNDARQQNAANLAANAKKMRQANFGLGSHLPENNKYAMQNLTQN